MSVLYNNLVYRIICVSFWNLEHGGYYSLWFVRASAATLRCNICVRTFLVCVVLHDSFSRGSDLFCVVQIYSVFIDDGDSSMI